MTIAAVYLVSPCRRVVVTLLLVSISFVAGPVEAQSVGIERTSHPGGATWKSAKPVIDVRSLEIDFVRASVQIEPSDAPNVELIKLADAEPNHRSAVSIVISEQDGQYRITDRYPARAASSQWVECLPPIDERGDFWHYDVSLKVKLRVSQNMTDSARTMAESVADRR